MSEAVKLRGLSQEQASELLPDGLIHLGFRGSIAHGMYVPQENPDSIDDKDLMGVFIAPIEHYLGFGRKDIKEKFVGEWDVVSYELVKIVQLLLKGNPNVLSMLWLPDVHVVFEDELGVRLREHRHLFVSRKAYHSFSGYAWSQFHRMTKFKFEGYMGEKRKSLVEKHGYDCKNAAHLIRLLKMGIEFLKDGYLHVERHDREQLLAIKRGEWTLEQVKSEAERLFKMSEEAYLQSALPAEPDFKAAERLVVELIVQKYGYLKIRKLEDCIGGLSGR